MRKPVMPKGIKARPPVDRGSGKANAPGQIKKGKPRTSAQPSKPR